MSEVKKKTIVKDEEDSPARNPIECLTQLKLSEKMTDLTIIIPGHDQQFKVHRLILSMWSSVFEAMLYGPMAEGDTITLKEDSPQAFKWLLDYMYKGETKLSSVELTIQVYMVADKYIMKHLKTICSESLIDKVTAERVPEILNIATQLEDEKLINKCSEVLEKSPDSFFSSECIGLLNSDSLKELLQCEDLPVSNEFVVFKGLMNWGRTQLKSQEKEATPSTLRIEVEEFLPDIRFLTMSLEDIVWHVLPENILTFKEVKAIQLNIAGVPGTTLTSLFSSKKETRGRFNLSKLQKCVIRGDGLNQYADERTKNPIILSNIKARNTIYLNKLEYESKIEFGNKITVKDSSGKQIQIVDFDGQVAKFDKLQLNPKETYNFSLNGTYDMFQNNFTIGKNSLISGSMMDGFNGLCFFHYWK